MRRLWFSLRAWDERSQWPCTPSWDQGWESRVLSRAQGWESRVQRHLQPRAQEAERAEKQAIYRQKRKTEKAKKKAWWFGSCATRTVWSARHQICCFRYSRNIGHKPRPSIQAGQITKGGQQYSRNLGWYRWRWWWLAECLLWIVVTVHLNLQFSLGLWSSSYLFFSCLCSIWRSLTYPTSNEIILIWSQVHCAQDIWFS